MNLDFCFGSQIRAQQMAVTTCFTISIWNNKDFHTTGLKSEQAGVKTLRILFQKLLES